MQQNELAGKGFGVDDFFLIFTKKTREIVANLLFFVNWRENGFVASEINRFSLQRRKSFFYFSNKLKNADFSMVAKQV